MKNSDQSRIHRDVYSSGPDDYHFSVFEFHRLRYLNHNTVNILSMLLVSLFDDFYPTLKH